MSVLSGLDFPTDCYVGSCMFWLVVHVHIIGFDPTSHSFHVDAVLEERNSASHVVAEVG